ncbi:MAG: hypothetical protein AAF581_09460 [Planctomycetota bacterium]
MSRYAGLEIDQDSIRLAIFEGSPKKFALVEFIDEEIIAASDEERREMISGILTDHLSRKENRGMDVICGLDSRNAMLREISVPYAKDEMIAKTIRFEAESYLHSHAIEDVVIEYLKCAETEGTSRLIICAVLKEVLESYFEDLKAINIDPSLVEIDATALATTFANTPLYSGEQNVLLLEVEENYSRMVFLERDRITKIRSVWGRSPGMDRVDRLLEEDAGDEPENGADAAGDDFSADGFADGISNDADDDPFASSGAAGSDAGGSGAAGSDVGTGSDAGALDASIEERFQEIERSLMNLDRVDDESLPSGDIPIAVISDDEYARLAAADLESMPVVIADDPSFARPPEVATDEGDPLERLFIEIERTFAAYVLRQPIDLIVVTGSQVQALDAVPKLAERFEVDVVPFDLGDSFPIQWDGDPDLLNRNGAVACGLGLRALGKGLTEFDLRKDEFRFERRYQKMMPALTLTAILCAALTFLWAASCYYDQKLFERDREILVQHQAELFEAFFEQKTDPVDVSGKAKRRLEQFKKGSNAKGTKIRQYVWPLAMMQDVANCVKNARVGTKKIYPKWQSFDFKTEVDDKEKSLVKLLLKDNSEVTALDSALKANSRLFNAVVNSSKEDEGVLVTLELRLKPSKIKELSGK